MTPIPSESGCKAPVRDCALLGGKDLYPILGASSGCERHRQHKCITIQCSASNCPDDGFSGIPACLILHKRRAREAFTIVIEPLALPTQPVTGEELAIAFTAFGAVKV